jgi:hypothetical protein
VGEVSVKSVSRIEAGCAIGNPLQALTKLRMLLSRLDCRSTSEIRGMRGARAACDLFSRLWLELFHLSKLYLG